MKSFLYLLAYWLRLGVWVRIKYVDGEMPVFIKGYFYKSDMLSSCRKPWRCDKGGEQGKIRGMYFFATRQFLQFVPFGWNAR